MHVNKNNRGEGFRQLEQVTFYSAYWLIVLQVQEERRKDYNLICSGNIMAKIFADERNVYDSLAS